jgi:signal transduction histidine kinase
MLRFAAIENLELGWRTRRATAVRLSATLAVNLALVAGIALADHATGYEVRLAILYLVPIAAATWLIGGAAGAGVALACVGAWLVTFSGSHPYTHDFYFYWEGAIYGACFLVVVALLSRLRTALARSDERFITVLEGLDAAVYVEDSRTGAILFANRRFGDERAGRPLGEAATLDGEVRDPASDRWYLVQSRPLQWIDGRRVRLRVLADITEEKRVRELLTRHRDAAHRSARLIALGEFASAIAHELSQPLAAVATYNNASLLALESGASDPAELRETMEKCRDQARRAGSIIQRLKELLRHPVPGLIEHDLNEVAQSARELAASEAREAGVEIELALAPQALRVRADRVLLQQVVLNLARNAMEACREGEPRWRRIGISTARAEGGGALLRVTDQGRGVQPDIVPSLFQPFVSTRPSGLGLGLSICRSVIETHGGTIAYRPNGTRGSVFELALPALEDA